MMYKTVMIKATENSQQLVNIRIKKKKNTHAHK